MRKVDYRIGCAVAYPDGGVWATAAVNGIKDAAIIAR